MYADYPYYRDIFHGNVIPPEAYDRAAVEADSYIDYVTIGTIKRLDGHGELPESAKLCACSLAELAYAASQNSPISAGNEPDVKSESVGPMSVTYATAADRAEARKALKAEMYSVCRQYLWAHMYRGVPVVG